MAEKRSRILIIDDDVALVEMLKTFLEEYDYQVEGVYSGYEGIQRAQQERPDLILLDIRLPDIDGYAVAQQLHNLVRTRTIPIIFLTELRDRGARLQGLRLGADDYIAKPFDLEELRLRIRNALALARRVHRYTSPTRLPSTALMLQTLDERLQQGQPWALLALLLENFARFQDRYGSLVAGDVLRALGKLLQYIQHSLEDTQEDLVGHLSDHNFGVLTVPRRLNAYQDAVRRIIVPKIPFFYSWEDRERLPPEQRLRIEMRSVTWREGPFTSTKQVLDALGIRLPLDDEALEAES